MTTTLSIVRAFASQLRRELVLALLGLQRARVRPPRQPYALPWPHGDGRAPGSGERAERA